MVSYTKCDRLFFLFKTNFIIIIIIIIIDVETIEEDIK